MKLLLDTHALLWFHEDDPRLSAAAAEAIEDSDNTCLVSYGSIWEMAIKSSLGKLRLQKSLPDFVKENIVGEGFAMLAIELDHVIRVEALPYHHGDPFDRLLVAQCMAEGLKLVSNDGRLDAYGIERAW